MFAPLRSNAIAPHRTSKAQYHPEGGGSGRLPVALAYGFTLIEMMITVAIISILAAIAYPNYSDYVKRGRLVNATNMMAGIRTQMEQYYQDNRTYAVAGTFTPPCQAIATVAEFSLSCSITNNGASYLMTATGSGSTAGFTYTVSEANIQQTTAAPTGWNTSTTCWVTSRGQSC